MLLLTGAQLAARKSFDPPRGLEVALPLHRASGGLFFWIGQIQKATREPEPSGPSHPRVRPRSGLGLVAPARAVRLLWSLCAFLRLMPADQTPRCCAYGAMMTCIVAGDASDDGAAFRLDCLAFSWAGRDARLGQRLSQNQTLRLNSVLTSPAQSGAFFVRYSKRGSSFRVQMILRSGRISK